MTIGWRGGEERGCRLEGPREAAKVMSEDPGLNLLPVAGCAVLAKFPLLRTGLVMVVVRITGTRATHTGLQQMRPLLLLTGWWRGEEAVLYFSCQSVYAPPNLPWPPVLS